MINIIINSYNKHIKYYNFKNISKIMIYFNNLEIKANGLEMEEEIHL